MARSPAPGFRRRGRAHRRSAAEAHLESRGSLPSRLEDLGKIPNDPWGKPYAVQFVKNRVRLSVDGAPTLALADLTPEEVSALDGNTRLGRRYEKFRNMGRAGIDFVDEGA